MAGTLGTIRGQIALDVRQAIAGYVAVRAQNATTLYALRRSSDAFLKAGKVMGGAGLLMVAGFGVAVKAAADFERQLDFFGAVTNTTEADMEKVRAKAIQLGQDTIYSAGQIADSFVELGKAGVSANQIIDGVGDAVASLGAAGDIPLDKAAQIMTSAVQTFELKAQDATHVADLLAGAANASIVEIEDLGVSLKYVGGVAASLSMPIEDVINGLSLLGKYGIRGSTAGTSLRQILVSLSGTSKKASKQLKDLGIITKDGTNLFFNAKGQAKPLGEIFQILQDKTKGLTEAQRLAAFKIIFNNRALAAANVLTREGAKGFANMNSEISKTTAADVAAKRLDNLSGDIEILKGNIETLLIQAGTPMQEFLRGIVQNITKLVQVFGNLSPSTQQMILKFLLFAGIGLLIMGAISSLVGMVLRFASAIIEIARAVGFVIKILGLLKTAFIEMGAAMLANPIGIVIAIILLLVVAFVILWKKSDAFRNFWKNLWANIVAGAKAAWAWFQTLPGWFSNLWNNIKSVTSSVWNSILTFFTSTVPTFFSNAWNSIVNGVTGFINGVVNWFQQLPGRVLAFVQMLVAGIISWFTQLPYRVGFLIGFMIGTIIRLWANLANWLLTTTVSIVTNVINFFMQLPGRIIAFFVQLWVRSVAIWNALRAAVIVAVVNLVNGVIAWFQALPGRVAAFVSAMHARAVSLFNSMRARAVSLANSLVNGVINFFTQLPGRVGSVLTSMVNGAIRIFGQMVAHGRQMASNVISAIRNGLAALPGVVDGAINAAISAFRGMVSRAFNAARSFASGLWDGFKKGLGINSPSFIEKQMWQITDVMDSETRRMRTQVRLVQNLGSRLTKVSAPDIGGGQIDTKALESSLNTLTTQYQKAKELDRNLQLAASSVRSSSDARNAMAVSGKALAPSASALASDTTAKSSRTRLVEGTLSLDESGRAFISGVAQDVLDGNEQYDAVTGRMG